MSSPHPAQIAQQAHGQRFDTSDPKKAAAALKSWCDAPQGLRDHVVAHLAYLQILALARVEAKLDAIGATGAATLDAFGELVALSRPPEDEPGGGAGETEPDDDAPVDDDGADLEIDDPTEEQAP